MSFDHLAPIYQLLETLRYGGRLQACRLIGLDWIEPPRHALLLGEGNGRFLAGLLDRFPETRVHVIDASPGMLAQARRRLERQRPEDRPRVRFQQFRVPESTLDPGAYDLLVTQFFLDCFDADGLADLLPHLDRCLSSHGHWLQSDFRLPPHGWPRHQARFWLSLMYRFFALTTDIEARHLIDPSPLLQDLGWQHTHRHSTNQGFLETTLWSRIHP